MQVSQAGSLLLAFDDPNLVSCAGLAPVLSLSSRCGLPELVANTLTLQAKAGVNADLNVKSDLKAGAVVAGMVAGADSIQDMDLLPQGGMDRLFDGVRAPSRRTFGHIRQLVAVAARVLARLAQACPPLPADDCVDAAAGRAVPRRHREASALRPVPPRRRRRAPPR